MSDPFEDPNFQKQRPKWQQPQTDFQRRVLGAVGLRYFPAKQDGGKEIRSQVLKVERSMLSLAIAGESAYPAEFVEDVIRWYEAKLSLQGHRALLGMLRSFNNAEWRDRFVREWKAKGAGTYSGQVIADRSELSKWGVE